MSLLRSAWRVSEKMTVTFRLPDGTELTGNVVGMGSKLGVQTPDLGLVEDVRAEQIVSVSVVERKAAKW
jgi:hypothetical protein